MPPSSGAALGTQKPGVLSGLQVSDYLLITFLEEIPKAIAHTRPLLKIAQSSILPFFLAAARSRDLLYSCAVAWKLQSKVMDFCTCSLPLL